MHKYLIGQNVNFTGDAGSASQVNGVYEVVRLLPSNDAGELQYRLKRSDGQERVVREDQLVAKAKTVFG